MGLGSKGKLPFAKSMSQIWHSYKVRAIIIVAVAGVVADKRTDLIKCHHSSQSILSTYSFNAQNSPGGQIDAIISLSYR